MDLILANRALVDHETLPGEGKGLAPAVGGLVEAVRPILVPWDGVDGTTWIGAGRGAQDQAWTDSAGLELLETAAGPIRHQRIYLGEADWQGYYSQVANGFFWPLLHLVRVDLPDKVNYYPTPAPPSDEAWEAFKRVNRAFGDAALAAGGRTCWVQDYQLALVPSVLREGGFSGRVGFFLHTPFPSLGVAESALPSPARARFSEWLRGIFSSDLVGVQTEADAERLRQAGEQLCGGRVDGPDIRVDGRLVRIAAFPVGIDTEDLSRQVLGSRLPSSVSDKRPLPLVVGLERADYTKGVPERLAAVGAALEEGMRFAYAGFSAPTRAGVPAYDDLQAECDRLATGISRLAAERNLPFIQSLETLRWTEVLALLREAAVVFTASLADGMNLVPLQAAVAQASRPLGERGVVLAGCDAGVASAYKDFREEGLVTFDPLDAGAARNALAEALNGRPGRVGDRLVAAIREHDAHAWGRNFLAALDNA